jgi:hypothetical protein
VREPAVGSGPGVSPVVVDGRSREDRLGPMRSATVVLALLAAVVAALPCHRCVPAGSKTAGAVVLLGTHAHEGHGHEHEDGCPGHDGGTDGEAPREPCCLDAPTDPISAPARVVVEAADPDVVERVAPPSAPPLFETLAAGWQPPVPRRPTETVVLLR